MSCAVKPLLPEISDNTMQSWLTDNGFLIGAKFRPKFNAWWR